MTTQLRHWLSRERDASNCFNCNERDPIVAGMPFGAGAVSRPLIVEDSFMISSRPVRVGVAVIIVAMALVGSSRAETIRVAVGTQDTTIKLRDRRIADPRTQAPGKIPAARGQV